MDKLEEWTPAIERRQPAYGRSEILFHLLLPLAALLVGVPLLIGSLHYVDVDTGVANPQLGFVVGVTLTALGGLELFVWRRRLRAPTAVEPAE